MCVAIYKPWDVSIPKDVLEACFKQNDDGAGFVTRLKGNKSGQPVFHLEKGFMTFEKFWEAYEEYNKEHQCLVHFRIATHGEINEANSHPHLFGQNMSHAMVHNGVLGNFTAASTKEKSDTRVFAERVLHPLAKNNPNFDKDDGLMSYVEDGIGYGNKVVILSRDEGRVKILNERAGDWKDGIWYSNLHWKSRMKPRDCVQTVWGQGGRTEITYDKEGNVTNTKSFPYHGHFESDRTPGADIRDRYNRMRAAQRMGFAETCGDEDECGDAEGAEKGVRLWNVGIANATRGLKVLYPGSDTYMNGYRHVVNENKDLPQFELGYEAALVNALKDPDKGSVWCLGWEWAQWHATINSTKREQAVTKPQTEQENAQEANQSIMAQIEASAEKRTATDLVELAKTRTAEGIQRKLGMN